MTRRIPAALKAMAAVVVAALTAGCGRDALPSTSHGEGITCLSGTFWRGEPSELMHPGGDCIGCHATAGGRAPEFVIAGTVYPNLDAPDDCYGVAGATVTITDAAGRSFSKVTNATGNYAFRPEEVRGLTFPVHAGVTVNGETNAMDPSQKSGACNDCHTATGARGAPGRVVVPGGEVSGR